MARKAEKREVDEFIEKMRRIREKVVAKADEAGSLVNGGYTANALMAAVELIDISILRTAGMLRPEHELEKRLAGDGEVSEIESSLNDIQSEIEAAGRGICDIAGGGQSWDSLNSAVAEVEEAIHTAYLMRK